MDIRLLKGTIPDGSQPGTRTPPSSVFDWSTSAESQVSVGTGDCHRVGVRDVVENRASEPVVTQKNETVVLSRIGRCPVCGCSGLGVG